MNTFLKRYSFLTGLIIFILILFKLDFFKLIHVLKEINYPYLIVAFSLTPLILIIKAYRWNYLKKKQKIYYHIKDSISMYAVGLFLGVFTPGRLGDLSKIIYLKNNHCSLGKSTVSVFLDRISDLLFLLIFGCLGMFFFFSLSQNFILLFALSLIFILISIIVFLQTNLIQSFLKKIFSFVIPSKYQKYWKLNFQDFINDLKIYKFKNCLFIFLITVFSWLIYYGQMFFLAKSINITSISFLSLSFAVTIAGFITLLPLSILGLGTRDIVLIPIFSIFSVPYEATVSFSMLILSTLLFMSLIGFFCWIIKPIQISGIFKKFSKS
jgi:uncharacterized protein (TIRG00374 family)